MRRAVLVAASRFEDPAFPPLRFAVRDAERLQAILEDPALGGFDQVVMLANPPGNVARIGLERTARACDPGDVLLFYFSGHGKLDRDGSLALAMSDSDTAVLGATSLVSDELKRILNLSKASQKIMILDCCYSGAVGVLGFKGALGDSIENLAQNFRGSFLLAASQRFERAWENEENEAGALTNALVEGVRTGAASKSGQDEITLSEIASYVKRTVPQDSPQLPEYWDSGGIGDVVFSKKPLLFDAEWARKVKAMVTRFVSTQVFDEDFADSIRGIVRVRNDPRQAARLKLLDRLLKKEVQISTFVTVWPTLVDCVPANGGEQTVVATEPQEGKLAAADAKRPDGAASAGAGPNQTGHSLRKEAIPVPPKIEPDRGTDRVPQAEVGPSARSREELGVRPSSEPHRGSGVETPVEPPIWKRPAFLAAALAFVLILVLVVGLALRTEDTALNSSADNASATAPADPYAVAVTATEDVFVRIYQQDGRDLYRGILRAGQRFQLPSTAVSPLIGTGRPNAIRVTVGATLIPSMGTPETPIDGVSLDPADLLARPPDNTGPGMGSKAAAAETEVAEKAQAPPPEQAKVESPPPRPMAIRPANVGPFLAFFDWQKTEVTNVTAAVLDNAIAAILDLQRGGDDVYVEVSGFTDIPDNAAAITRGRALAVKRYLVSGGIPASAIAAKGYGTSRPLVEVADGVREPQNRRAEIVVSIRSPL